MWNENVTIGVEQYQPVEIERRTENLENVNVKRGKRPTT